MGNGIFTRNYDNIMALIRMPKVWNVTEQTIDTSLPYGDKSLRLKTYTLNEIIPKHKLHDVFVAKRWYITCPLSYLITTPTKEPNFPVNDIYGGYTSLYVGKDNTEETYDDVDLISSSNISGNFDASKDLQYTAFVIDDFIYDEDNEVYKRTYHYNFVACKNTVIGEFGLYYNAFSFNNNNNAHCLIYRKALESPIELEQNQTVRISMTISVPANPNKPVSVDIDAE